MLTILSVAFLIGCAIRGTLYFVDDAFGGPVWTAIFYISSLTWVVGAVLAVFVLTGATGITLGVTE